MLTSTTPSEWARSLVSGAYDLHVHVAPDVMPRRVTDVQFARRCWDAGLAGFVLKSHYVPTAERAAVVNEALGGEVGVLGGLALNASIGGMNPLAATREVLKLAARHQLVVATGHLAAPEIRAVADAALEAGVRHVIITHPDFPQQDLPLDDQLALARMGAFLERCFATPFTGNCGWAGMLAGIKATGPGQTIIATDLGQPGNPPVEGGLALMADALRAAGFTDGEITTMIVDNSRLLAGADPLPPDGGAVRPAGGAGLKPVVTVEREGT